ncbi:MAG: hypothetical protein ACRD2Z_17900, partial [Thermoanaerobaculia bacterium]
LGPVELLVADPEVQQRVAPTRFPQAIESALADVAMQASRGRAGSRLAAQQEAVREAWRHPEE